MRTLVTFGLGALTMYLLDPQQGRRRRALIRDQINQVSHRAHGVGLEAQRAVTSDLEPQRAAETPQGAQHLGR
jgi:hypothetical protein